MSFKASIISVLNTRTSKTKRKKPKAKTKRAVSRRKPSVLINLDPENKIKVVVAKIKKPLETATKKILKPTKHNGKSVEIVLSTPEFVRTLNKTFRGKDKTTDVLSFKSWVPGVLGSIAIDVERAVAQAKEYKHSLEREVYELSIHGIFHLLGFDHENEADARIMKKLELKWTRGVKI